MEAPDRREWPRTEQEIRRNISAVVPNLPDEPPESSQIPTKPGPVVNNE